MLAIKGIYDGKTIKPLEKLPKNRKYKVIITFIEEVDEIEQLINFSAQTTSFNFWENQKEDLYQDYLTKRK